jgi:protein-export membrane protein SecD
MGQGKLTFQFVDDKTLDILSNTPNAFDEEGNIIRKDLIPEDSEVVYRYRKDKYGNYIREKPTVLKKKVELDGSYITKVSVIQGQFGPEVTFILNSEGASRFAKLTGNNVGKYLAIVLDGRVQEIARIKEAIPSGRVSITGQFSVEEANDLALILRAGSLPVPLAIIEKTEIGATLGKDSIQKGVMASLIALIIVTLFMIIYYKISGLIATLLLGLNLFFLIAFLAAFRYTLTLPGIAGIILNIGIGVDAFVIIFERIKEELKTGKSTRLAVEAGFKKAFLTIFDANLTTLIAALALAQLGAGPIRGFAVTLSIGIIMNLLVTLVTGRMIFTSLYNKDEQKLYI